MKGIIAIIAVLLVSLCANAQNGPLPTPIEIKGPSGSAGNNSIWYQTGNFFSLKNIKNPIQVGITYPSGSSNTEANICLNSNEAGLPVSGVNFQSICPTGGFGYSANVTEGTQKSLSHQLLTSDEFNPNATYYANVHVRPSANASGLIVTLPDMNSTQEFFVVLSGIQCEEGTYPVSSDGSCVPIDPIGIGSTVFNLAQGGWAYYQFTVQQYDPTEINSLTVSLNASNYGATLYLQSGYYPTADWYLNLDGEDDDGVYSTTILTPGGYSEPETIHIGIWNTGDESLPLNLTVSVETCLASLFGPGCSHNSSNSTSPISGYLPLNATVSNSNVTEDGHVYSFDYSDDDDFSGDFAYFTLTGLPTNNTWTQVKPPYYVRVTVASNDVRKGAPGLYAKKGSFPSAQSNHYNVSTEGDVSHQIVLRIDKEDLDNQLEQEYIWHFAVELPADFSIWAGFNCANDCNNQEHGVCFCNGQSCQNVTEDFENGFAFYERPVNLLDSSGACTCSDDDYEDSFDCSQRSNPYLWIWVVAVVVAAVIIIFIIVAVPVFCLVQHKRRRAEYETIDNPQD